MANFSQAIKWLREGKKVHRKHWGGFLLLDEDGVIRDLFNNNASYKKMWTMDNFEADDWEEWKK